MITFRNVYSFYSLLPWLILLTRFSCTQDDKVIDRGGMAVPSALSPVRLGIFPEQQNMEIDVKINVVVEHKSQFTWQECICAGS